MVLDVVSVHPISIDPSSVADRGPCFVKPRLNSGIDRMIGLGNPVFLVLQSFCKSVFRLSLGLAVEILPLTGRILVLGAPFTVFPLENATFRTYVVYGTGEAGWRLGRKMPICSKKKLSGPLGVGRLHSFGL